MGPKLSHFSCSRNPKSPPLDFLVDCSSPIDDIITDPSTRHCKINDSPTWKRTVSNTHGSHRSGAYCVCSKLPPSFSASYSFRTNSFGDVATDLRTLAPSGDGNTIWQRDCALTDLKVRRIPIQEWDVLVITMTLLQILSPLRLRGGWRFWKESGFSSELGPLCGAPVR
jgi:hypothetical protein